MSKKIIFLDCDGTLFDIPRGLEKPTNKTKYAINKLIEDGNLVFIASGRSKCLMNKDILSLNPTGYITSNGAYAFNKETTIFKNDLRQELVDKVIEYCNMHDGVYYLETQDYIKTLDINNPLHIAFIDCWAVESSIFINDDFNRENYQILMASFKNELSCLDFEKEMKGIVDYRRQYGFTSYDIGEFGIDKGYAVKKILDYYGIDKKDAYCFGDGLNDIEMFKEVEESYAVNNANTKLKQVAKHIAPDVLEDGFYQTMVLEGLINPSEE